MKLLVIEDDAETAAYLANGLREEGHVVDHAATGRDGLFFAATGGYDVLIVDRMLPELDGIAVVKTMRAAGVNAPVLFLTALGGVSDRVNGLNAGGDDYLVKPFAFSEFLARVRALARRSRGGGTVISYADVRLDVATRQVERGGRALELTAKEFALLAYFLRHAGEVLSRGRIYEDVWHEPYDGLSNTLEVHVMELRRKLETRGPRLVHTLRGRGYVLESREEPVP